MTERGTSIYPIRQLRRLELMIAPLRIAIAVVPLWLIYGMFRELSPVDVSGLYHPTIWLTFGLVVVGLARTAMAFLVGPDHLLFRQAISLGDLFEAIRADGLLSVLPTPTRLFALKLIDVAVVTPIALILMMGFLASGHHVMSLFASEGLASSWMMGIFGWANALLFIGFILIGVRRVVVAVGSANEDDFAMARSILSTFKS